MRHLTLTEYEPADVDLAPAQVAALRDAVPSLGASPSRDGRVTLHPGHHVGTVVVDDLTVHLTPKVGVAPVMFLLAYTADPTHWREQLTAFETADRLLDSFVPGFLAHLRRALRRGPLQGYRSVENAEPTVRGRLRFDDQLRHRHGRFPPAELRYDEFTVDTQLNRLLKAAIVRLGRLPLRHRRLPVKLQRAARTLDGVELVRYHPARVPEVTFDRLNEHYRPAVTLARLALANLGTRHLAGAAPASTFLVDMNALFETFIVTALREHLDLSTAAFPQNARGHRLHLDRAGRIGLHPDLSWWQQRRCDFVGDVKYKVTTAAGVPSPDLYQLLAYTIATGLARGLLVYAAGEAEPRDHYICHADKRLHVRTVNIAAEPDDILAGIATVAKEITTMRHDPSTSPPHRSPHRDDRPTAFAPPSHEPG